MPEWITSLGPLWASIATGLLLWAGQAISRRWGKKHPETPTWPEIWDRIEAQDKRIEALEHQDKKKTRVFAGILTRLLEQWPEEQLPRFQDEEELDFLRETIPSSLFRRLRRA
jgi:hypothetical protein